MQNTSSSSIGLESPSVTYR